MPQIAESNASHPPVANCARLFCSLLQCLSEFTTNPALELKKMIPKNETGLPLVDAVEQATGRRPHLSTVLRWTQRINRYGVRLESWIYGGRRVTSPEAVHRYNEQSTAVANGTLPTATPRQRSNAHSAAKARLAKEFA